MAADYEVVGQREQFGRLPDGEFGKVVRVSFKVTGADVVRSVDVPTASYSAATVKAAIEEAVRHTNEVQDL